jgi:hypothetical protein
MRAPIEFPRGRGFDRAYWLSRCEGFLVESADGSRIGTVVDLHYRSRLEQPDELVVRAGWLGRRLLIYSAEAVQTVVPGKARLILAAGATPSGNSRSEPDEAA